MLKKIEEKIDLISSESRLHHGENSFISLKEIEWMIETIKRQNEEIYHLTVLRTTVHYEERRASERALLKIAQSKVLERAEHKKGRG